MSRLPFGVQAIAAKSNQKDRQCLARKKAVLKLNAFPL
jgi:hypothetical protein